MNNWVAGWSKRMKVTISGSLVEENMTDFPFMIKFDATSSGIFDELGDNSKKIAIYDNNNEECPVEIEYWSQADTEAVIWTKAPTLTSGISESFYVYYDSLHHDNPMVGDTGDAAAAKVWDDNFIAVYHLAQDPTGSVLDSTSNQLNMTASNMEASDLISCQPGKGLEFDGVNEILYVNTSGKLTDYPVTMEVMGEITSGGNNPLIGLGDKDRSNQQVILGVSGGKSYLNFYSGTSYSSFGTEVIPVGNFAYVAGVFDNSTSRSQFMNGGDKQIDTSSDAWPSGVDRFSIGSTADSSINYYSGKTSEARFSNTVRRDSWIRATYYSSSNQLLSYGSEELLSNQAEEAGTNYVEMTIPAHKIDNDLYDFPVMVYLSSDSGIDNQDLTAVFDALESDANKNKIFFTQDKKSQLFAEREYWDHSSEKAYLWIKIPELSSTSDNVIYMYYDKAYEENTEFVGATNSIAARNVWSSDYVMVIHLNQDPSGGVTSIKDSTMNECHSWDITGSMATEDLINGTCVEFDGIDDGIRLAYDPYLSEDFMFAIKLYATTTHQIDSQSTTGTAGISGQRYAVYPDNTYGRFGSGSAGAGISVGTNGISVYIHGSDPSLLAPLSVYNGTIGTGLNNIVVWFENNQAKIYLNGSLIHTGLTAARTVYSPANVGGVTYGLFPGTICDFFVSSLKSEAWIKTENYSFNDELIYYEPPEGWLTGWDKRLKITIDHNKIDEGLVDFPILIALTSGTGTNSFDATDIFNDYSYSNGINWQDFQMVVNTGAEGTYDTSNAANPCVVISGSKYMMWYTGYDGSYNRIIYCDSDDGISWYNHQMVINRGAEGTYDTTHAYRGSVLLDDDGKYKMWYSGSNSSYIRGIYCDSTDGKNWSNHQMVVDVGSEGTYDNNDILGMKVIKDGSTYKMWYGGYTSGIGNYQIIYCTSTDGKNWSNFQRVIAPGDEGTYDTNHVFPGNVIKDGSTYIMWYSGSEATNRYRIIRCTSTDGINWSNHQMVINTNTEGTYDTDDVNDTWVIKEGTFYKMWYGGNDSSNNRTLYAISDDSIDNAKKIAITDDTGIKQLYGEIESFNGLDEKAFIWTKVPYVSSTEDTILYLYYDISKSDNITYIGETGDAVAQNVWDDNFLAVYHLNFNESLQVLDSTSNSYNLSNSNMGLPNIEENSIGLKGLNFNGTNEYLTNSSFSLSSTPCTMEVLGKHDLNKSSVAFTISDKDANDQSIILSTRDASNKAQGALYSTAYNYIESTTIFSDNQEVYLSWILENSTNRRLYVDGVQENSDTDSDALPSNIDSINLGALVRTSTVYDYGSIFEARLSTSARSDAWIKATYYSNWNNLSSFAEETQPLYYYDGYVKEQGSPVARTVRLYRRYNGELVSQTVSSSTTGYYYLTTSYNEQHFVVAFDDDLGETYNAIIYDKVDPEGTI